MTDLLAGATAAFGRFGVGSSITGIMSSGLSLVLPGKKDVSWIVSDQGRRASDLRRSAGLDAMDEVSASSSFCVSDIPRPILVPSLLFGTSWSSPVLRRNGLRSYLASCVDLEGMNLNVEFIRYEKIFWNEDSASGR